jgi:hypothetical protein
MTAATTTGEITRNDLETKFRELRGEVDSATDSAKQYVVVAGAVVAVTVIAVAFFLGRRRGKRSTTVVEVRRL